MWCTLKKIVPNLLYILQKIWCVLDYTWPSSDQSANIYVHFLTITNRSYWVVCNPLHCNISYYVYLRVALVHDDCNLKGNKIFKKYSTSQVTLTLNLPWNVNAHLIICMNIIRIMGVRSTCTKSDLVGWTTYNIQINNLLYFSGIRPQVRPPSQIFKLLCNLFREGDSLSATGIEYVYCL